MSNIRLVVIVFCSLLLLIISSAQIISSQKEKLTKTEKTLNLDKELNIIKEKLDAIEKNKLTGNSDQTEQIKQTLSISSDTVKYVGTVAAIILPLIIFLIGYQVIRSYQFEREIRETRKLMTDEYQKMLSIRSESEMIIGETKSKMGNLEEFVGALATDILHKRTSNLVIEVKEQAEQALTEIKTKKDEEMSKSIELMKKLETLDLTLTPSVYIERGSIYYEQGNLEKSVESFSKAIEMKTDNFEAYFKRGLSYHKMKKFDEAISDYFQAAKINTNEPPLFANIGICYRAKEDYEKSIQNITKALELRPHYEFAYIQRSITYALMKKYDLAINDLKEAEKQNPNSIFILDKLGLYYGRMGNFDSAIDYYLKAIEKEKRLSSMMNLSEAYICKKDYINAEKWANESYSISDNVRNKVMSKFLLVTALILSNKEYKIELKSIIDMLKETIDFDIGTWSFEELSGCLTEPSIPQEKSKLVTKLVALLEKEIKPEDFSFT